VQTSDLVLVRGLANTRATLDAWNDRPWPVVARWFGGSLAITALLLVAVWFVATQSVPDPVPVTFAGLDGRPQLGQVWLVLGRNSLVLALHAFACIAGFIAGSSLPLAAEQRSGLWRWVHDKAGPLAIAFVIGATGFSLITQTFVLGRGAASLAEHLDIGPALLLVGLLPHALPELSGAVPAARRVDDRQPPAQLARPAGGDRGHGDARRSAADRFGVRRSLRQPRRAALARGLSSRRLGMLDRPSRTLPARTLSP
jgi:hypothetical protein